MERDLVIGKLLATSILLLLFNGIKAQQCTPYTVKEGKDGRFCNAITVNKKLYMAVDGMGVISHNLTADTNSQLNKGLPNLMVTAIIYYKGKLLAATKFNGLFMFDEKKQTWKKNKHLVTDSSFWQFAECKGYLFVASESKGIFRSSDGESWEQLTINIASKNEVQDKGRTIITWFKLFAHQSTLYAATGSGEVVYSADAGITWNNIVPRYPKGEVRGFFVDTTGVYVGIYGGGVFYYNPYSNNWTLMCNDTETFYVSSIIKINNKLVITRYRNGGVYILENGSYKKVLPEYKWADFVELLPDGRILVAVDGDKYALCNKLLQAE